MGQTIQYKVNSFGQVTSEIFTDGSEIDYAYDPHGNLTSAKDSTGTIVLDYKDPTNPDLLTKITYASGRFLQFTYVNGQRTQMVDQTGFTVVYHYDAAGRLDSLLDQKGNVIVKYHYDAAGRIDLRTMGNGTTTTYGYDPAGQVLHIVSARKCTRHFPGASSSDPSAAF